MNKDMCKFFNAFLYVSSFEARNLPEEIGLALLIFLTGNLAKRRRPYSTTMNQRHFTKLAMAGQPIDLHFLMFAIMPRRLYLGSAMNSGSILSYCCPVPFVEV